MYELKQSICYPGFGADANEDTVGYGRNYCFVMDGVSCLSGKKLIDPVSDAAWMTRKIRDSLCALLDADDPRPTEALLLQVVAQVREEYLQALRKQGTARPEEGPAACLALFRLRNGCLEFFGVGDCVGVAKLPDGTDFYALDEKLPVLDQQALDRMHALHKKTGITMQEAKQTCTEILTRNRNLRNKPDGYWVLDLLTDDGIKNAAKRSWALTAPICVGAFSDGFAQLTEVFAQYKDYPALFAAMRENDLEEMFCRLCALQDADADCTRYPRFKHRDDTSALWGIFTPDK